jgi:hypothetical protein
MNEFLCEKNGSLVVVGMKFVFAVSNNKQNIYPLQS